MSLLPVEPAYRLAERSEEHRWLVTGLWSEQAVGIVGGEPKCCKSFLALRRPRRSRSRERPPMPPMIPMLFPTQDLDMGV